MRLFVAIALPEDVRDRLAALQHGVPGARWVAPENLHLTLRFIGEVDGHQAQDIDAALTGVHVPSFPLTLAGVGHFGCNAKTRSLWAGVEAGEPLKRLQAKVEQALQRAGVEPKGGKFKPHVTLARFKSNPGARLYDYLSRHALFRTQPFMAEHFVLYSSFLSQSGAIYRAEADYDLTRAPMAAGAPGEVSHGGS